MKNRIIYSLFFLLLVTFIILAGCTLPAGTADSNRTDNTTAAAISIALDNSTVRTYLTEPWTIMDVHSDATTSIAEGGAEEIRHTPDVIIATESRILHVYVDLDTNSVVYIWDSPKRVPLPP